MFQEAPGEGEMQESQDVGDVPGVCAPVPVLNSVCAPSPVVLRALRVTGSLTEPFTGEETKAPGSKVSSQDHAVVGGRRQDLLPGGHAPGPACSITTPSGLPAAEGPPRCHHLGATLAWKDPPSSLSVSFLEGKENED